MVFAAGRGQRMRPLSDAVPKPALPTPSGPVVCAAIRQAIASGCERIVVNTWHLADRMEAAIHRCEVRGCDLVCSNETELMGTAGGLALARDSGLLSTDGPVLVINGDCLSDLSLEPLIRHFNACDDLVSLGLIPHPDPTRWSRVFLHDGGTVGEILPPNEDPHDRSSLLYPGVMVVSREALDGLVATPHGVGEGLWAPARACGRLGGAVVNGRWTEVGTPADYLEAVRHQLEGRSVVDPSVSLGTDVDVSGAFVGRAACLGSCSRVIDSIVTDGAVVGREATITRSVLLGPVQIAAGATVVDEFHAAPPST